MTRPSPVRGVAAHALLALTLLLSSPLWAEMTKGHLETALETAETGGDKQVERLAAPMVQIHNHYRQAVGVDGLTWSPTLAAYAAHWAETLAADRCVMRHRKPNAYGENIYWNSARVWSTGEREPIPVTPKQVVDSWAGEQKDYNADNNTCATGRVCGHYTQMVWRGTQEVGCARRFCPDHGQIWVCNYTPPGNIVGQRPF